MRSVTLLTAAVFMASLPWPARAEPPDRLPDTKELTDTGDLSAKMLAGVHRYLERKLDDSVKTRSRYWQRDATSTEAYTKSVAPNRDHLRTILGVVDPRVPPQLERFGDDDNPALVAETEAYQVYQVRWRVLDGVTA